LHSVLLGKFLNECRTKIFYSRARVYQGFKAPLRPLLRQVQQNFVALAATNPKLHGMAATLVAQTIFQ